MLCGYNLSAILQGFNALAKDADQRTPLHFAAAKGHKNTLNWFVFIFLGCEDDSGCWRASIEAHLMVLLH
jgi:hypothetical protein